MSTTGPGPTPVSGVPASSTYRAAPPRSDPALSATAPSDPASMQRDVADKRRSPGASSPVPHTPSGPGPGVITNSGSELKFPLPQFSVAPSAAYAPHVRAPSRS